MDEDNFLVEHFIEDFMVAYGLCISITQNHPSQANNELKNAIVHYCRSEYPDRFSDVQDPVTDPRSELEQAINHLRRGKRDCYKMVLFTLGDEIASALTSIEITHGVINPAFKSRLRSIRRKRMKLYAQETMGASVTDGLQTLVDEMLQLQEDICSKYTVPNSIINKFKRCWFKVKKFLFGVFSGLLMAIIIFVVFPVNPISTINSLLQQLNIPTQINAYGQENSNKE